MNALVMYDRQTDSLWSQLLGEAVEGPLTGMRLEPIPAVQTRWAAWREAFPDTEALDIGSDRALDAYSAYYDSPRGGVVPETRRDDRLATKDLVTGAIIGGQPAAWPKTWLEARGLHQVEIAGWPVLAVQEPRAGTTMVYDRRVDDRTLDFELFESSSQGPPVLIDDQTGSYWSIWSGAAFEGPSAGRRLERIASTTAFWFGWKDYHPETWLAGAVP